MNLEQIIQRAVLDKIPKNMGGRPFLTQSDELLISVRKTGEKHVSISIGKKRTYQNKVEWTATTHNTPLTDVSDNKLSTVVLDWRPMESAAYSDVNEMMDLLQVERS